MGRLREQLDAVEVQQAHDLPALRALEWLDALAGSWQETDLVEEQSDVIHAVYERIVVEGPRFVGVLEAEAGWCALEPEPDDGHDRGEDRGDRRDPYVCPHLASDPVSPIRLGRHGHDVATA
jgi:hypothetical protein